MSFLSTYKIKNILLTIITLLVTTMLLNNTIANDLHHYKLKLSSTLIEFDSPTNYSKDFPKPQSLDKNINIFDANSYGDTGTHSVLQQLYFDFGKGFIFGKVNGTLEATLVLRKTNLKDIDNNNPGQLLKSLEHDFYTEFSKQDLKDYDIKVNNEFSTVNISNIEWSYFDYTTNSIHNYAYAIPLSETHYLQVIFRYIDNSTGEKNNWKEQAANYQKNILESFQITSY